MMQLTHGSDQLHHLQHGLIEQTTRHPAGCLHQHSHVIMREIKGQSAVITVFLIPHPQKK